MELGDKAVQLVKLGCVQYNGGDDIRNYQRADALLSDYPELSAADFHAALVAHDTEAVYRFLEADPALATRVGGPLNWPALMYVTYSRINLAAGQVSAIDIVDRLLELGADPNGYVLMQETYRFTVMTGAMGEGERGIHQPAHAQADVLVKRLLDAGANPNEGQGLYNTMFTDSVDHWLRVLLKAGLDAQQLLNWDADPNGASVKTLDFVLASAVNGNSVSRVRFLLEAGADANAKNTYDGRYVHTNAVLKGHEQIAEMLLQHGAIAEDLSLPYQFRVACVKSDSASMEAMLVAHPGLLSDATLLHDAAHYAEPCVYQWMIEQGFDINGMVNHGRTLLHHFALQNNVKQVQFLIDAGADVEALDDSYQSSPLGFAAHERKMDVVTCLLQHSENFLDAIRCAYVQQVKALLKKDETQVQLRSETGNTCLHSIGIWVFEPADNQVCRDLVKTLLDYGADISAVNNAGQTPKEFQVSIGAQWVADVLADYE